MKLKQEWYRSNNNSYKCFYFFTGLNWQLVGGEQSFGSWGDFPIPPVGKPCINFANRFLYTIKDLCAHHIHHVPKWPSYFCKIWAHIWYIFIPIMNTFNQAQWLKKYLSKEHLSLNIIIHTCSWLAQKKLPKWLRNICKINKQMCF